MLNIEKNLTPRLKMIASLVPKCKSLCDIGTDHAYVAIYLAKKGVAEKIIAADIKKGPLTQAEKNIRAFEVSDKIETRLSDGLENLKPSEAEVILIAGMGGALTVHILSEGLERIQEATDLILQPQSERGAVRKFLLSHGFAITEETCCVEDGKFYNSIHAVNLRKLPEAEFTGETTDYEPAELEFGKLLLQEQNPVLYAHLKNERLSLFVSVCSFHLS